MSKKVICPYCGQQFDKDEEDFVKVSNGRRYAHVVCFNIIDKMENLLGSKCNKTKISRQIKSFLEDGKTVEGIYKTLQYWYDVKKSTTELAAGGIGIVPFLYDEAETYYEQQATRMKISQYKISDFIDEDNKPVTLTRKYVKRPKRVKLFNIG